MLKAARACIRAKSAAGTMPFGDQGLGGQQLDLQPDFQLALFGPDVPHFGPRITLYHVVLIKGVQGPGARIFAPAQPSVARAHRAQRLAILLRAASRICRSRSVRLWMPWAEIFSRMGSTSRLMNSAGGSSSGFRRVPRQARFGARFGRFAPRRPPPREGPPEFKRRRRTAASESTPCPSTSPQVRGVRDTGVEDGKAEERAENSD